MGIEERDSKGKIVKIDNSDKIGTKYNYTGQMKMIPETISKLETAFALGCSDREACLLADISMTLLYRYQKKNPEFVERKRTLKNTPVLSARKELVAGLVENPELALKFLERKRKGEFGTRQELKHSGEIKTVQELSEEQKEKIDTFLSNIKELENEDSKLQE